MSTALTFNLSESDRLRKHLATLAMLDIAELVSMVSFEGENQTRRRIKSEKTSPGGEAWPEWSAGYKATRHGNQGLLMSEGNLLDSITADPDGSVAAWGSIEPYTAIHNFGGAALGINIPQREFLGLSDENLLDIENLIIGWIEDKSGVAA